MRKTMLAVLGLASMALAAPTVNDPTLRVNRWTGGFDQPTAGAWLGGGDLLVAEKATGRVKLVRDKQLVGTVLDLPVASESEQGLVGMTLSPGFASDKLVYLYYTVAARDGGTPIANKIARYKWTGTELQFDRKIRDLPATPGPNHDGGKMVFDKAGNLLVTLGDLNRREKQVNQSDSSTVGYAGTVLRMSRNGKSVPTNPFYSASRVGRADEPLNDIYAHGLRNSFGLDIDPVTGDVWESQNGTDKFDEINRLRPGANGGWRTFQGPIARAGVDETDLVSLGEASYYADPRFSWARPVAPTDVLFQTNARLGRDYLNTMFVGATKEGLIYNFDLSASRKSLDLSGNLADGVADNTAGLTAEQSQVIFGQGFGLVSDLFAGPGGLYVVDYANGTLYRVTTTGSASNATFVAAVPEPSATIIAFMTAATIFHRRFRMPGWKAENG